MTRRDFLKSLSLASLGLIAAKVLPKQQVPNQPIQLPIDEFEPPFKVTGKQWVNYSWKWKGGYGRISPSTVLRIETQ